ncbi:Tectonic-1 [Rhizoclosmatium hyalinum]|nr:Tectonic-1 [Rhizoclosmatium hyalinum]
MYNTHLLLIALLLHRSVNAAATATVNLTATLTISLPLPTGAIPINWTLAEQAIAFPTTLNIQQDLGQCTCDLTLNSCDIGCCCDPDCASLYSSLNFKCTGNTASNDNVVRMCSSLLAMVNPLASTNLVAYKDSDSNQLCVVINNSPIKGFYYADPGTFYQTDSFFSSQMQMNPYLFSRQSYDILSTLPSTSGTVNPTILAQPYSIGDYLVAQYTDIPGYGVFSLPAPSMSGSCNDGSPAKFLVPSSKTCNRIVPMGTAPDICKSGTPFDVSYYLTGFQLVTSTSTQMSLSSMSCIDPVSGTSVACSTIVPFWNTTAAICQNILTSITFNFTYAVSNGATTIISVNTTTRFSNLNLPSISTAVMQSFSAIWTLQNSTPQPKSGNPGYQIGKPILFGTLLTQPLPAIAYFPTKQSTLTLPQDIYSKGVLGCAQTPGERLEITFGEDVLSGCTLYYTYQDLQQGNCANVRSAAYVAVTGGVQGLSKVDVINMVGKFGNSSLVKVSEWVPVISSNIGDSSQPATNPGTCSSVLTALDVQFITAKLGSSNNPQSVIIGARIVKTWGAFTYRCILPNDCRNVGGLLPRRLQKFRVRASVSFVGVNGGVGIVQPFVPPPPRLIPLLPDDIFYPFSLPGN